MLRSEDPLITSYFGDSRKSIAESGSNRSRAGVRPAAPARVLAPLRAAPASELRSSQSINCIVDKAVRRCMHVARKFDHEELPSEIGRFIVDDNYLRHVSMSLNPVNDVGIDPVDD